MALAAAEGAAPQAEAAGKSTGLCSFCVRADVPGRKHGARFLCTSCESVDRLVRRNIGSLPLLDDADRTSFYSKALSAKSGPKHEWRLVRAALKESFVRRKMRMSGVRVDAPWKPALYWENQGYSPSKIRNCPSREDSRYGTLYQVEVTTEVDKRYEEEVEQELLEREAQVTRKRKAKGAPAEAGGEPEWILPEEAPAGPSAAKAAKKVPASSAKAEEREKEKLAKEAAKREKSNANLAASAGKAMCLLHPKVEQLKTALKLMEGRPGFDELVKEAQEAMAKVMDWIQKSRELVGAHTACPSGFMPRLPYDAASLKATVQATGELARWVREKVKEDKLEQKAAAAVAEPKAQPKAKGKAKAAAAAPKSRCKGKKPDASEAMEAAFAEATDADTATQPYPDA